MCSNRPVATRRNILTLPRGIFGPALGTLIVSFASSIGATLAFLASRFLLRTWFRRSSATSEDDLRRHRQGRRLLSVYTAPVPAFPFFVINL